MEQCSRTSSITGMQLIILINYVHVVRSGLEFFPAIYLLFAKSTISSQEGPLLPLL